MRITAHVFVKFDLQRFRWRYWAHIRERGKRSRSLGKLEYTHRLYTSQWAAIQAAKLTLGKLGVEIESAFACAIVWPDGRVSPGVSYRRVGKQLRIEKSRQP